MLLYLSTWLEVEAYLQRSRGIIIPIGSTEQHGPTGLIGTDFICAETIAKGISQTRDVMVSSTLTIGMAEHHTAFPGTISLRPSTLMLVLRDYIHSLARYGFERFFFINGHGGNINIMRSAFCEIYSELPQVRCQIANWWVGQEVSKLARELYGDREGFHATPSEVALTMYAYPEAIKQAELAPLSSSTMKIYSPQDFRARYPDGRMGSDPSLATVEHGKKFFEVAVTEIGEQYQRFMTES
ncbi:MAG: amidase [Cyanobacteria bacterium M5B4]|nr:MAG: amidase [Cyanobacteria bacterium M5B4]